MEWARMEWARMGRGGQAGCVFVFVGGGVRGRGGQEGGGRESTVRGSRQGRWGRKQVIQGGDKGVGREARRKTPGKALERV